MTVLLVILPTADIGAAIRIGIGALAVEQVVFEFTNIQIAIGKGQRALAKLTNILERPVIFLAKGPGFDTQTFY